MTPGRIDRSHILAALADADGELATLAIGRAIGRAVTFRTMIPLERAGLVQARTVRCGMGLHTPKPTSVQRYWTITDAGRRAL